MNGEALVSTNNVGTHFWTDRMYGVTEHFVKPKTAKELATRSLRLGKAFASLGKSEEAMREFNAARNFDSNNTEILEERAALLIRLEQYEDALDDLALAETIAPSTVERHVTRSLAYFSLDAKELSVKELDSAIELDGNCDVAHYYKAIVLTELGDYLGAVHSLDAAIYLVQSAPYLALRGHLQSKLGNHLASIADFSDAIDSDSTLIEPYLGRGNMYIETEEYALSIEDFSFVISEAPNNPHAWFQRGFAKMLLGENASALQDFEQAARLDSSYASAPQKLLEQLAFQSCHSNSHTPIYNQ